MQSPQDGLPGSPIIRTPDQRLRVFISSTLKELAEEREAAKQAVLNLRMNPVLYELGARPYPPRSLYQAYLAQSHVFVGIYWQQYGWVAPDMTISGLEDEFQLAKEIPKLIYIKRPAPEQDPKLTKLLQSIKDDASISYKYFSTVDELRELVENDLALLLTERFELTRPSSQHELAGYSERQNTIPQLLTLLLGRERELQEVQTLLRRLDVRLVTLTGPGGVGKTSLGLEVAARLASAFPDGLVWVPLAAISDPELVVSSVARSLDVRERSGMSLLESLQDYLRDRSMLLLLDNFEQVLPAGQMIAALLAVAPGLKLLATSRAGLRVRGEHEYPVRPLPLPDGSEFTSIEELMQNPAVRLFVERNQAVNHAFRLTEENASDVIEIVRRLDGLPLALELVAARAKVLNPHDMLRRLETRFQLLSGGAQDLPARQQTLRNTLDWSYNLLNPKLQTLFSRLSVFAGGFTLETAEAVCNPDQDLDILEGIAALLDNSLLRYKTSARLGMLETIREYASERLLESGERDKFRRKHALFFARLAAEAGTRMYSEESEIWLNRLEAEYDNFRHALTWLQETPDLRPVAWQCIIDLVWLWYRRGYLNEAHQWFENSVEQSKTTSHRPLRGFMLVQAGAIAMWQSDLARALQLMDEGVGILRTSGQSAVLAQALFSHGVLSVNRAEPEKAKPFLEESLKLCEQLGQGWFQAMCHLHLGNVALSERLLQAAVTRMETALELGKGVADDWIIASVLNNFGEIARYQQEYQRAEAYYLESRDLFESVEAYPDVARAYHSLGYVSLARGDQNEARQLFEKSLELHQKLGVKRGVIEAVCGLGALLADQGQVELFVQLLGMIESQFTSLGGDLWPADRSEVKRRMEAARQQLGESACAAAFASGKKIDLRKAIAMAMEIHGTRK